MKKLLLFILFFLPVRHLHSQALPGAEVGADSVSTAILPVLGYSSDLGLMVGGLFTRYDYSGNIRPFNNLKQAKAIISTKGYLDAEIFYEETNSFGRGIRTSFEAYGNRFKDNAFFGIGNTTSYSQQLWDDGYYFFESISFGLDLSLRKPVYQRGRAQFDLAAGLGFDYQIAYENQSNSSFSRIMPNGSDGGFVNYLKGGFVWENRDSEFDPQSGNRAELEIMYAPKYLSEFPLTTARLDLRQYVRVAGLITLAGRVEALHAGGDVPYWELPTLGEEYSLRGYPLNRFKGNSSLSYNLEMRTWFLRFPQYGLKFGAHAFTDGGRVFTRQNDFGDLFHNHKHTYGVGGAFSAFSPDFIARADLGFSDNSTQLYIGIGYMF